jgi:hypothetical protein
MNYQDQYKKDKKDIVEEIMYFYRNFSWAVSIWWGFKSNTRSLMTKNIVRKWTCCLRNCCLETNGKTLSKAYTKIS